MSFQLCPSGRRWSNCFCSAVLLYGLRFLAVVSQSIYLFIIIISFFSFAAAALRPALSALSGRIHSLRASFWPLSAVVRPSLSGHPVTFRSMIIQPFASSICIRYLCLLSVVRSSFFSVLHPSMSSLSFGPSLIVSPFLHLYWSPLIAIRSCPFGLRPRSCVPSIVPTTCPLPRPYPALRPLLHGCCTASTTVRQPLHLATPAVFHPFPPLRPFRIRAVSGRIGYVGI